MKSSTTPKAATNRRKTPAKTGQIRQLNKRVDVVLGRGKGCTCSKGNQRYLSLIEKYAPEYVQAKSRKEQNDVKLNIIREVREYEGHFLQPVEGSSESEWEEAPLETVLNKIAQSLRYHIRKGKISPVVDSERMSPHQVNHHQHVQHYQQQPLDAFQSTTAFAHQATAAPVIKPTDIWTSGFQMNQPQLSLPQQHQQHQHHHHHQAFATTQPMNLLDDRRDFHLPAMVTPPQPQMAVRGGGGGEEFGMFSNEFLRKVAFFGRIPDDSGDPVGV